MKMFVSSSSCLALSLMGLAACSAGPEATRDSTASQTSGLTLTRIVDGLEFPWAMAFLPDGSMLVSEREGFLALVKDGTKTRISGTPKALVDRQGGYLGLVLDPDFETNRTLYLSFSHGSRSSNSTAVLKGVLSDDASTLSDTEIIYEATKRNTTLHYGGRMQFLPDGTLLLTLGDGFRFSKEAQNTANTHGAIVRIHTDGSIPADNPFAGQEEAAGEIYTFGHRNVQGLYVDPETGKILAHEHGPKGGDEVNELTPGANYGWPEITYGVNYDGSLVTRDTEREGLEQPLYKWVPSIAPSGLIKYTGDIYPGWKGDLFLGAMYGPAGQKLVRLDMENGEIVGQEDLFAETQIGFRDVAQGPDGKLYLATADLDGAIYRIDPATP